MAAIETCLAQDGIALVAIGRPNNQAIWPYARRVFFALKERIPDRLKTL
jgi:hypothetical protein